MPTVVAGTQLDIQKSPEKIVLELIKSRWNLEQEGQVPPKDQISFSLFGWMGRKSFQISVESSTAATVTPLSIGEPYLYRYNDPVVVHVWVLKNTDDVPDSIHNITQKIEQIINENITNVGWGIHSMRLMTQFSAIEAREFYSVETGIVTSLQNQTEQSLWHSQALTELLYFKYVTRVSTVSVSKTHKYNILNT